MTGEYYWLSLSRSLEPCPDEEESSRSWATVWVVGAVIVVVAILAALKDRIDARLTKRCGKWYTIPAGTIGFTFANGRGKVMWSTFTIIKTVSWNW